MALQPILKSTATPAAAPVALGGKEKTGVENRRPSKDKVEASITVKPVKTEQTGLRNASRTGAGDSSKATNVFKGLLSQDDLDGFETADCTARFEDQSVHGHVNGFNGFNLRKEGNKSVITSQALGRASKPNAPIAAGNLKGALSQDEFDELEELDEEGVSASRKPSAPKTDSDSRSDRKQLSVNVELDNPFDDDEEVDF